MLRRYEALMLAVPEITQDEIKNIESQLDGLVRKVKGTTISFERWGKYKLAYPVKRNDYGVYFLMRFEADDYTDLLKDIDTVFKIKLNNVVMRSIISDLPMDASLVYQRPKSLEEGNSTGESSSFLKEKKVEGLLSAVKSSGKKVDTKADEQKTVVKEVTEEKETEQAPANTDEEPTA
jgi:small subunit ribosomal protein S6